MRGRAAGGGSYREFRGKLKGEIPDLISTSPATRVERRLANLLLAALAGALLVTIPFAKILLPTTETLLPAYAAGVILVELITSVLLLTLYAIARSPAVLILAGGYLFTAILIVPWLLTFPGMSDLISINDAGEQSTAWIAALRRLGFPVFAIVYGLLRRRQTETERTHRSAMRVILGFVAAITVAAAVPTWVAIAFSDELPQLMIDERTVSALWSYVPATALVLYVVGIALLSRRQISVLDLWLIVALCTLCIEVVLLAYFSASRLSVGWWAGRLYGLVSASIVLIVLLSETMTLYSRLIRSGLAEQQARFSHLAMMEALSASIAHEVNQPLASMVTNAGAGLRWLDKATPNIDETRAALNRISSDGHRAAEVVKNIREVFKNGTGERVPLNLNRLIGRVIQCNRKETRLKRISVNVKLDEHLPQILGNPVQLEQVISNLVLNAIDAMSAVSGRKRVLQVTTALQTDGNVLVSIEDSGIGLDSVERGRIFEPYYTTKPQGMGVGLTFCQSIIEAHGGRLWLADAEAGGAIFNFALPGAEYDGASVARLR